MFYLCGGSYGGSIVKNENGNYFAMLLEMEKENSAFQCRFMSLIIQSGTVTGMNTQCGQKRLSFEPGLKFEQVRGWILYGKGGQGWNWGHSQVNKFEQVQVVVTWRPPPCGQTDRLKTENITFPQLHWREVIRVGTNFKVLEDISPPYSASLLRTLHTIAENILVPCDYYRPVGPLTKVREGNVFTGVCQSFCSLVDTHPSAEAPDT